MGVRAPQDLREEGASRGRPTSAKIHKLLLIYRQDHCFSPVEWRLHQRQEKSDDCPEQTQRGDKPPVAHQYLDIIEEIGLVLCTG